MRFNSKKCYILSVKNKSQHYYSLGGSILQRVQNNPYLGIEFSEDLKWSSHISKITKKANSVIGFLRRNLSHCPTACRRNAYLSLVRSVIEYGAIVWDPYLQQDIDCFDRVQRKGVRFITGDYKSRSPGCVTAMLASQNLSSLQGRRKKLRLAFLFKLVEGTVPAICAENYLTPQRPKRAIRLKSFSDHITNNILDSQVTNNTKCFRVPLSQTEQYRQSFFARTIVDWNHLADDVVNAPSADAFRNRLENVQSCS